MRVTMLVLVLSGGLAGGASCDSGEGARRLGATCSEDGDCASGLCLESICLDPDTDDDEDGLLNRIEGAIGTNALLADSDADGKPDAYEVGAVAAPADQDQDARIDAVESATADADRDCVPDERDAVDDPPPTDQVVCCISAVECPNGQECVQGRCVARGRCFFEGCATGQVCDPESGLCVSADPRACISDEDCDGGTCLDGRCVQR